MHRQRKRDLNLKPNRVLDKRSSRGMIYENEELRLRTLAIADDVDRGQNDIKKLRKENEHLKREIWNLRDECEKLEEILKKVVASGGGALDPSDLPYPQLFMDRKDSYYADDGDENSSLFDEDDPNMTLRNMFMMEDEGNETGSVIEQPLTQNEGSPTSQDLPSPEVLENGSKFGSYSHHALWGHAAIPPDLEAVREETESIRTNSCCPLSDSPSSDIILPHPNNVQYNNETSEGQAEASNSEGLSVQESNTPLIQITPASSPSSFQTESQAHSPLTLGAASPETYQDGGCVTELPKMFQVTSQIHVDNSLNEEIVTPNVEVNIDAVSDSPLTSLPPASPKIIKIVHSSRKKDIASSYRHSVSGEESPKASTAVRGHPLIQKKVDLSSRSRGLTFSPNCCHNFHSSWYQSEPALSSCRAVDEYFNGSRGGHPGHSTMTFGSNPAGGSGRLSWWSSIDKNLVVGYLVEGSGEGCDSGGNLIKAQDIIDELELRFDSSLEKIKGIRMILPSRVFISLRDPSNVKQLLAEFGEGEKEFRVKGQHKIIFMDGSQRCSEVRVLGVPGEISDFELICTLNKYGQVVCPLEGRNYKGVEICERVARMHLVKNLPDTLTLSGYQVQLIMSKGGQMPGAEIIKSDSLCETLPSPTLPTSHNSCVNVISNNIPSVTCHSSANVKSPQPVNTSVNNTTTAANPSQNNQSPGCLKPHKPVGRSTSSNPRLESSATNAPASPIVPKRQSSVCTANLSPDQHPSKLQVGVTPTAATPTLQVSKNTATTTNSTPNLLPTNGKKPLSRLLRSSPGSLIPHKATASSATEASNAANASNINGQEAASPGVGGGGPASGLRAAFYRSLSIDPRRGSMVSQAGENNNVEKGRGGAYYSSRRNSGNLYGGQGGGRFSGGGGQGHQALSPMNSNSSSQFERGGSGRGFGSGGVSGSGPKEPLPWCGCWGNGCI